MVHGNVQGVFFRDSTREWALREGVSGWARNREDGTVEVVLQGDPDAVARVERFCESGPSRAQVTEVERIDEPIECLAGFEIS